MWGSGGRQSGTIPGRKALEVENRYLTGEVAAR